MDDVIKNELISQQWSASISTRRNFNNIFDIFIATASTPHTRAADYRLCFDCRNSPAAYRACRGAQCLGQNKDSSRRAAWVSLLIAILFLDQWTATKTLAAIILHILMASSAWLSLENDAAQEWIVGANRFQSSLSMVWYHRAARLWYVINVSLQTSYRMPAKISYLWCGKYLRKRDCAMSAQFLAYQA